MRCLKKYLLVVFAIVLVLSLFYMAKPMHSSALTKKPKTKILIKSTAGIYNGQIDGNSIEITVKKVPMAFRFTDESKVKFKAKHLKKKARVKITYYKNEYGQLILKDIK